MFTALKYISQVFSIKCPNHKALNLTIQRAHHITSSTFVIKITPVYLYATIYIFYYRNNLLYIQNIKRFV